MLDGGGLEPLRVNARWSRIDRQAALWSSSPVRDGPGDPRCVPLDPMDHDG
jgi:hypothetical protein